MKLAVVQQNHNPGRPDENRQKAIFAADEALRQGCDLILFHEELLTGYCMSAREMAETADGKTTQLFQQLLKGTQSCIIYGLTERDGDNYYISAPVVMKDGLVALYRKTHLYGNKSGLRNEKNFFTPGNHFVMFSHLGVKIGLLICYDGDFFESVEYYRKKDCQLVLWMNNRESRGPEDLVRDHAVRNSMIMAVSCCCGTDELGISCPGGSCIVNQHGMVLGEIWNREGILFAEIDPSGIEIERKKNPWINDRRGDLY